MATYEPIPMRPMRIRGIFGITWEVYKRNWLSGTLYSLLYILIIFLLIFAFIYPVAVNCLNELAELSFSYNPRPGDIIRVLSGVFGVLTVSMLAAAAVQLLLTPIYTGTMYMQMSLRIQGGADSIGGMLKQSGQSFKRFFSASLAQGLVSAGFAAAAGILASVPLSMSLVFTALSRDITGAIYSVIIVTAILMAGLIFLHCFINFTLPVAANEGLRGFKALGRSFKLSAKKIWRIFGCVLIVTVCFAAVQIAFYYLLERLGLWEEYPKIASVAASLAVEAVLFSLSAPYFQALFTVLYYDARVRADEGRSVKPKASSVSQNALRLDQAEGETASGDLQATPIPPVEKLEEPQTDES